MSKKKYKFKKSLNFYFLSFDLLKVDEKFYTIFLLFSSLINGFLQIFALFGVIPFINLIVEKNNFYNTNLGIFVKNNIGFFDVNNLLLLSAVFLILIVLFKNFYSWFHVGLVAKFIAKIEVRMRNNTLDKVIHSRFEWINNYNSNYLREVVFNYAGAWGSQFVKSLLILKNELLILFYSWYFNLYGSIFCSDFNNFICISWYDNNFYCQK